VENIIVERLAINNTKIFELLMTYSDNISAESKILSNNQEKNTFLNESQSIVNNYFALALTTPELFEDCNFEINTNIFASYTFNVQVKRFLQLVLTYKNI